MTQDWQTTLKTEQATRILGNALGRALAAHCPEGVICLFFGEMAAGKTTLIKSICEGLGINPAQVISPTYTLVNIYPAATSVYHVDLFRIEDGEAMLDMDRADWINPRGMTLIEWPERAMPLLEPEQRLEVRMEALPDGSFRQFSLGGNHPALAGITVVLAGTVIA